MKTLIILAMILFTGATAYPQSNRSARESKNEKSSSHSSSSSRSVRSSDSKPSQRQKSVASRPSASSSSRTADYRQKAASRDNDRNAATRVNQNHQRSTTSASRQVHSTRQAVSTPARTAESANRSTQSRSPKYQGENSRAVSPDMKGSSSSSRSTTTRAYRPVSEERDRTHTSSATRVFRESKNALTRDDGSVIRHQNDDVFTSNRFNLDYNNFEDMRRSDHFRREYRDYDNWHHRRHPRIIHEYHYRYRPIPLEIRRVRYIYRHPVHISLIWTPRLLHRFMYYYPTHNNWRVDFGQEIETISSYDAESWVGTVQRVYGKVEEVYYNPDDETYTLYMGAPFPYQDVSVVIPKHIAQSFSLSPKWYFENELIWVVGLINTWENKPEIVVRDRDQIRRY